MSIAIGEVDFQFRLRASEIRSGVGAGSRVMPFDHVFEFVKKYTSGVGANKVGAVYSENVNIENGTPRLIDLRGSLVALDGVTPIAFPIVMGVFVRNNSTTSGQSLTVGGGSNPFISWLIATGDGIKVGPDGFDGKWSPVDGYPTTAGTADILQIVSDVGIVNADILLLGRAS